MTQTKLKKKYRITSKLMEILEIITEAKESDGNFFWHVVDGARIIYPIQITDFKVEADVVFISVENKSTYFREGEVVYMRFPSRDAVFKSKIHRLNDFDLVLDFPTEILACERRKNIRHPFHLTDEKKIQVRLTSDPHGNVKSHFLRTLDVSENGAAVFITRELQSVYSKGTSILVEALGDHKLSPPQIGTITSQFPYSLKTQSTVEEGFKVGIGVDTAFANVPFTNFLVRPSLYTIDEKRLVASTVFRNKVHDVMGSTLQKILKNKTSKNVLQKINFDRADPDYVQVHIKLLCEVLCGVGMKLGWVSERTLDKLIYVAYLHDAALLDKPQLAKIQTKQELERRKDLTAEDRKLVLDAPLYAAELARQDQQSYPDVIKILAQQRELPDGSGFPQGLSGSQLTPLSCLFIFSHYFVDYMIDNSNWDLDTFLKTYQRLLKGTYFSKIFQVLRADP